MKNNDYKHLNQTIKPIMVNRAAKQTFLVKWGSHMKLSKQGVFVALFVFSVFQSSTAISRKGPWLGATKKPLASTTGQSDGASCVSNETCLLAAIALKDWICSHVNGAQYEEGDPNMIDKIYQDAMKKWGSECGDFKMVTVPASEDFYNPEYSSLSWSPSDEADWCVEKAKEYLGSPVCGDGIQQKGEECDLGKNNGKKFTSGTGETFECDSTCHAIKTQKPPAPSPLPCGGVLGK